MHEAGELVTAHRRVLELFRETRPTNAAGVLLWDHVDRENPMTAYVIDHAAHHARQSHVGDETSSEKLLLKWLTEDAPQDALSESISSVLGMEKLTTVAEAAEGAGRWWDAACWWAAAAALREHIYDMSHFLRAGQALSKAKNPSGVSGAAFDLAFDHLELVVINNLIMFDLPHLLDHMARMERLLQTAPGKARPDQCINYYIICVVFARWVTAATQDVKREVAMRYLDFVVNISLSHPDLAMRDFFAQLISWASFWIPECLVEPGFDWKIYGDNGQHCLAAIKSYNYSKHHMKIRAINMDSGSLMMSSVPLGVHWGNLDAIDDAFAIMGEAVSRALLEPDQAHELWGYLAMSTQHWPYTFGKSQEFGALIQTAMGKSWAAIEAHCDFEGVRMWFSPRGEPVEVSASASSLFHVAQIRQ